MAVDARWLLGIAVKLLQKRYLSESKYYAARARESDPEQADQILAIIDTLIAGDTRIGDQKSDWYAILQLDPRNSDTELIASQFRRLSVLLNPSRNKFPFVNHAFKLIVEAWLILSNPIKKFEFDCEISGATSSNNQPHLDLIQQNYEQLPAPPQAKPQTPPPQQNQPTPLPLPQAKPPRTKASAFWTGCPYCYYMYEYPEAFVEYTLRCQNCKRAFHAIRFSTPPVVAAGGDTYLCCFGFSPFAVSTPLMEKNKAGASNWTPSSVALPQGGNGSDVGKRKKTVGDDDSLVDLSSNDDSD